MEGGKEEGRGGWEGGREGREGGRDDVGERGNEGGREGMEGGREAGMMLCRDRASVEEERVEGGRVDEGNERGRDGTGYGRPRERGEGGSERRMD